jgi:WD40 repeat protein
MGWEVAVNAVLTSRCCSISRGAVLVCVCLRPDGYAIAISLPRRVLLHRFNFKHPVRDLCFSPDDRYVAVSSGRKLQLWRAPGMKREFAPFSLHRTYTGHFDDITCISWAPNGRWDCCNAQHVHCASMHLCVVAGAASACPP